MILAFHSIFGAYGFWLPNEPRGSWSDFVASWYLYYYYYGPATRVQTRRSIADRPYDPALKRQMQSALTHPQCASLAGRRWSSLAIGAAGYSLHALAVMPNPVHAVIGHTPRDIRRVVGHLKAESTRALRAHGWFLDCSPWCDRGWNVYFDTAQAVTRAIRYVHNNPLRDGLRPQRWSFVQAYCPHRSMAGAWPPVDA